MMPCAYRARTDWKRRRTFIAVGRLRIANISSLRPPIFTLSFPTVILFDAGWPMRAEAYICTA